MLGTSPRKPDLFSSFEGKEISIVSAYSWLNVLSTSFFSPRQHSASVTSVALALLDCLFQFPQAEFSRSRRTEEIGERGKEGGEGGRGSGRVEGEKSEAGMKGERANQFNFITQGLRFQIYACSCDQSLLIHMPVSYI